MPDLDVLYLTFNRKNFTELSLKHLIKNTDWNLVNKLVVYDDGSEDGTVELVRLLLERSQVPNWEIVEDGHTGSPVIIMNRYVEKATSEWFAKIDSDIVVSPEWLPKMLSVVEATPGLEALGMEPGRSGKPKAFQTEYTFAPGSHMGGVGLIRTASLGERPQIAADGRFGWTQFQQEHDLVRGWIAPDILMFSLDQLPFEPWSGLATEYNALGWQRRWPPYHARWMSSYWEWAFPVQKEAK